MVLLRAKGKQSRQVADSEWAALKSKTVTSHSDPRGEKKAFEGRYRILKEFPNDTILMTQEIRLVTESAQNGKKESM